VKYQPLYSWVDSVVIDWEWREIPTLIYSWVDSVVIDWEWREIPTLIYSWLDSVVIDWEWRAHLSFNVDQLHVLPKIST
jgi:hypothetical protein